MSFECIRNVKQVQPVLAFAGRRNVPAFVVALALAAGPALSGPLGIDVDVGIGRGGVSVGADVGVGGTSVGADVGIGGGGTSGGSGGGIGVGADVGIGGGNVGVGVGVGGGGIGVGVDIGLGGGTTTPGGGTPGTPGVPGVPGVPGAPVDTASNGAVGALVCAKGGNMTAYNGFVVRDRAGETIGWVHEATVSATGKLQSVRLQSTGSTCYKLAGGGLKLGNGEVRANVDAASFR